MFFSHTLFNLLLPIPSPQKSLRALSTVRKLTLCLASTVQLFFPFVFLTLNFLHSVLWHSEILHFYTVRSITFSLTDFLSFAGLKLELASLSLSLSLTHLSTSNLSSTLLKINIYIVSFYTFKIFNVWDLFCHVDSASSIFNS